MRTAAKVFVIISMVADTILGLLYFPVGLLLIGWSIGWGIHICNVLSDEFEKPSVGSSIITLLFLSPIAGILMLCIPDEYSTQRYYYPGASTSALLQCEKCGKRDMVVRYYTVQTALGKMNRAFCPECKEIFDNEQNKR